MTLTIKNVKSEAESITLTLNAKGEDKGGLKDLPSYVDQTARLLDESQKLNFKRWKILDHKVHMNFQALGSYEAEVQFMKNCVKERLVKFDGYVKSNN